MATPVVQWLCRELSRILGVDAPEDIANYILMMETKKDVEDYMTELLDPSIPRQRRFIKELLEKWRPPRQVDVPQDAQVYMKSKEESLVPAQEKGQKGRKKNRKQQEVINLQPPPPEEPHTNGVLPLKEIPYGPIDKTKPKNKSKFVPLFSEQGKQATTAAQLPGRHPCECQASKHTLVSNCTGCGRVVCTQEGSGPCIFCGKLVCSREEQEVLDRGSKKSDRLRQQLMTGMAPSQQARMQEGLERATKHKDRLLEYDRTSVKKTQVLDDESDYFATEGNSWLSDKEKEKLRKREEELRKIRHGSRLDKKFTLDFAGRRVMQEDTKVDVYDVNDDIVQEIHYGKNKPKAAEFQLEYNEFFDLVNPNIKQEPPQFVPVNDGEKQVSNAWSSEAAENGVSGKKRQLRLQDSQLQELRDEGVCLSMHQPWASLLVAGIKIHEGRSWYTPHRGRLWIAATNKDVLPQETAELEQHYRYMYNDADLQFPEAYPTACLLGCVDLKDCLAQDVYREQFPDGESKSPFVFICDNPQELVLKQPNKGKPKIYKLDGQVHQSIKRGLRCPAPFLKS